MANDYYSDSGAPSTGSAGSSATIRAEFASIEAGFDKMADLTGNGDLPVFVNSGATGQEAISASSARTKLGVSSAADTQNQAANWCGTATGTADVITATVTPAITAYAAGQTFRFISSGANTTNVTININSLGAKAITKNGATALGAGDIPSGAVIEIVYDGTRFQFIGVVADRLTQNQTPNWCGTAGGTADVITTSVTPALTAYTAGQVFRFISSGANTTNVTININSLGAKAVTKNGTTALEAGDIPSGAIVEIIYDGTRFQVVGVAFHSGATILSSNTALTTAHKGRLVIVSGNSGAVTLTMPASATFSDGDGMSFLNASPTYNVTLTRAGSDVFNPGSSSVNSVTLKPGDTFSCSLYASGASWEATGGSAQLAYTSIFGSSIAGSGYQKLPSGLIIQWGAVTTNASGDATITFPLAFPTAAHNGQATAAAGGLTSYSVVINILGTTTMAIKSTSGGANIAVAVNWIAIGV